MTPAQFYIFVDGTPVAAQTGQTVLQAIEAWQPDIAKSLREGARALTDSRGLPTTLEAPAFAGGIFRVVSARGSRDS